MIGSEMKAGAAMRATGAVAGKRAMAVGQQARAAVAEARAGGAELPRNAQGVAASAIARGADPASVFAALVTPEVPPEPVAPNDGPDLPGTGDTPPVGEAPGDLVADETGEPGGGDGEEDAGVTGVGPAAPGLTVDDGEIALALLQERADAV